MKNTLFLRTLTTAALLLLAGCEIPGLGPDPQIAKNEADAKAIGSACRHGLRGIEDCYKQNEDASKSDIFTGWKDMDLYMRENKIEGVLAAVVKAVPVEEVIEAADPKAALKPNARIDSKAKPATETNEKQTAKQAAKETAAAPRVPTAAPVKPAAKEGSSY